MKELKPEMARLVAAAKALSDPLRLELLRILASPESCCGQGVCVCDLVERTGALQSLISYHMKILREAGLVTEEARGKWKHYRIDPGAIRGLLSGWSALLLEGGPATTARPVRIDTALTSGIESKP